MALKCGGLRYTITEDSMKTLTTAAFGAVLLAIAAPSQAQNIVAWLTIKGIAQANNIP
jgi:hypothetical protein